MSDKLKLNMHRDHAPHWRARTHPEKTRHSPWPPTRHHRPPPIPPSPVTSSSALLPPAPSSSTPPSSTPSPPPGITRHEPDGTAHNPTKRTRISVENSETEDHQYLTGGPDDDVDMKMTPSNNGEDFIHRVIGAYAPWDPDLPTTSDFWPELTNLCSKMTTSWTLGGDLNATISAAERASGRAEAHAQYLEFLQHAIGHNIWTNNPERNRTYDWTSHANKDSDKGNIIDHIVTSKRSYVDTEISVTDRFQDFFLCTNHHAVIAKIAYTPPSGTANTVFPIFNAVLNKARIKYPMRIEKHRHDDFRAEIDAKLDDANLDNICVTDDESFLKVYNSFTDIPIPTAEKSYGRVIRFTRQSDQHVMSPKIEKTVSRL
ncbi:hypothetical protein C8R44DRAFT_883672 [Mycena epipterygia]|nr:hypothetical protein C8R44DRAFT_883672 [Mycena epipterygia]